jgi:hypothetical protein
MTFNSVVLEDTVSIAKVSIYLLVKVCDSKPTDTKSQKDPDKPIDIQGGQLTRRVFLTLDLACPPKHDGDDVDANRVVRLMATKTHAAAKTI